MNSPNRQLIVEALLLGAIVALFLAAWAGQHQLAEASRRVEQGVQRERALGEVLQLVSQAESGQRGYVLVGDSRYLATYEEAVEKLPAALVQFTQVFATAAPAVLADVREIERLSRAKFAEMGETLKLYHDRGRSAAVALVRTDAGQETMVQLTDHARAIQSAEADAILEVSRTWRADRWVSLALMTGAATVCLLLIYVLRRLVRRYVFSKERETEALNERQGELERAVQRSTEDLSELSTHLQSVAEKERATLSRELHDELGGLLVAARMDVSWLEERVAASDPEVLDHFKRVQDALLAGVDLKRRVVENLRPTLLDNLGLFPALRWQVAEYCGRAGIQWVERYPKEELNLTPE
ncbi:MAG TPA: CHASE3 domain-containing protein, partial [Solirubrobacteraceae bacterium]